MNIKKNTKAYSAVIKNRSQGFTLAELLVVVAIIAILVAVSIPIFTGKLDEARAATCKSNCRALKAEISVALLSGDGVPGLVGTSISNYALRENYGSNFDFDKFCPSGGQISAEVTEASGDGTGSVHIYCSEHNPKYLSWVSGQSYKVGDLMQYDNDGYILKCEKAVTANSITPKKANWIVTGTIDGLPKEYASSLKYPAGFRVTYKGKTYKRVDYDLSGGQTPYTTGDSKYWTLIE